MAEGFERIETDSVADLQLSVADSLELGAAAAEDRASDGDSREASDLFDGADENIPIGADGAGGTSVIAESPTSVLATHRSPLSEVQEVSNLSEQMLPHWSGRTDADSSGDARQVPTSIGSLPPNISGVGSVRPNVSIHSAGVLQYALPVDSDSVRANNSVRPRSLEGSGRYQVTADPLLGQVNYTTPIAGASIYARHVTPIDASVQGPRFTAMPPQSISSPIVLRPTTMVRQGATPPFMGATPPVQAE